MSCPQSYINLAKCHKKNSFVSDMKKQRPFVLSIAGFDPSAGAGILADIKTFEQCKTYGLGVISCNTIQTDSLFHRLEEVPHEFVFQQIKTTLETYQPKFVKIGLVPHIHFFKEAISLIHSLVPEAKIIWDPILKSSTGFDFNHSYSNIYDVLKQIYIITPNWDEAILLSGEKEAYSGAVLLSKHTHVFLKGGHSVENPGKDYLYTQEQKMYPFRPKNKAHITPKHGSGCVFSSALTAYLSNGYPLLRACLKAKQYTARFLASQNSLLGYHLH